MQYTILTISSWQRIPRSFVNKCWEGISNPVLLLLPNGVEWKVKWKKLDADILLIEDWKEFAEFCSLDKDHLLVFEYLRKSQFLVVIFDQNGLEMEYPLMGGTLDGDEKGNSLCQHKRAKSPLPFSSSIKKVKGKTLTSYPSHGVRTERAQSQRTKVEFSKEFLAEDLERGACERAISLLSFCRFRSKIASIITLWFLCHVDFINRWQRKRDDECKKEML